MKNKIKIEEIFDAKDPSFFKENGDYKCDMMGFTLYYSQLEQDESLLTLINRLYDFPKYEWIGDLLLKIKKEKIKSIEIENWPEIIKFGQKDDYGVQRSSYIIVCVIPGMLECQITSLNGVKWTKSEEEYAAEYEMQKK